MGDERASDFRENRRHELGLDRLPPASRAKDPPTSKAAGDSFERRGLSELHEAVLAALRERPMTDEELETLPQFSQYAPSTIRKRRSEMTLMEHPRIKVYDTVVNSRGKSMLRWRLA